MLESFTEALEVVDADTSRLPLYLYQMRDIMPCKDCKYKHNEHDTYEYGYGMCMSCTPKKLNALIEQVHEVRIDAGREWDVKMAEKKKAYINKKAASLEKKALRIYNSKRPAGYEEITDVSKL